MLYDIITHFVKVRNRLQTKSTNRSWKLLEVLSHQCATLWYSCINTARWQKMEGLLMKAINHTAFWEIKYYFVTMMFSRVFWYSKGSSKRNNVKIHQAVQRRFNLKLKKMLSLWAHVAKTSRGGYYSNHLSECCTQICIFHYMISVIIMMAEEGAQFICPDNICRHYTSQHTVFLKRLNAIWMDCKQAEHLILD